MNKKFFYLLSVLLMCAPVFASNVKYSFTVGTGINTPLMIMDPYTVGLYSPYYMYNRPYYRNYLYYGGHSFFAPPPPLGPMPALKHRKPGIRLHPHHKR